ncbi:MAG TPA: ATP-binding protein [Stellaceae bacterium]|nr:ATP-binding protein [Stellaceae bacterium]
MIASLRLAPFRLYPLLDWFVPEKMKAEAESLRRARMFLISHLFGPFLGHTISLYILVIGPAPDAAWWIFFSVITLFWAFPLLLKITGWFVPLALISVQNLIFTILWGCYHYGGMSSPLIPWVITVPLLAFFYLGSGQGVRIFVLAIILLNLGSFYLVYCFGHGFPQHIALAQLSGLGIVSTVCASVYVSMMALYYANIAMSQSDLEREVKRRLETATQLREATKEADRANQAKSEFLAKLGHELRTPLNAVIGYSEIMLEDAGIAERRQQSFDLKKIHSAGNHLLKLITDLLDLSKLEAGKMELFVETVDVRSLIEGVAGEYRNAAAAAGNALTVDIDPAIDTIEGDATKLRRALADLVDNAIRFTTNGTVTITTRGDGEWLRLAVRDTGIGIEKRRLATLFENFEEPEEATTSKYGETGLGLPLSQRLCRLMRGDIAVESSLGEGSCFTIRVPTALRDGAMAEGDEAAARDARQRARGSLVLAIDDDPGVLELLQRILAKEGYTPVIAASAFEGLELAKKLVPALIILDVFMPELDGWQLLKLLRKDAALGDSRIIMLTVDDNVQKGLALGADAHLVKPIDRQALLRLISHLGVEPSSFGARLLDRPAAHLLEDAQV